MFIIQENIVLSAFKIRINEFKFFIHLYQLIGIIFFLLCKI